MASNNSVSSNPTRISVWENLDWIYKGVDFNIAGTGGPDCVNFIPTRQKYAETIFVVLLCLTEMRYAWKNISFKNYVQPKPQADPIVKRILLIVLLLVFGMELGFKLATRRMIWVLNPCHFATICQIFLLAAPQNKYSCFVFRAHLYILAGATTAMFLPDVKARMLPFEVEVFYIQHILILTIPFYFIKSGGVYTLEPLNDFAFGLAAKSFIYLYHWLLLQPLSIISQVNLNTSVCPFRSDPFYGKWYRMCAVCHMFLIVLAHGKLYGLIAKFTNNLSFSFPKPSNNKIN